MLTPKQTKITIDLFMTLFLVLSFVRWEGMGGAIYHMAVGSACALFFSAHVFVHRKWIKATTTACFAGKLNKKLRWKYTTDMALLVVWGVSIITGFLAIAPFFTGMAGMGMARLHGITARVGLVLIVVHVVQHLPQIKAYMGIRKRTKAVQH